MKVLTVLCFIMLTALPPTFGAVVGEWTFNDGTLNDTSADPAPVGTLVGSAALASDIVRGWVVTSLRGMPPAPADSNYLDLHDPTKLAVTDELTISVWVKTTTNFTDNWQDVVGRKGDYGIQLTGEGGAPRFWVTTSNDPCSTIAVGNSLTCNDGQWHNIIGTFSKATGKMAIYVDYIEGGAPSPTTLLAGTSIRYVSGNNTFAASINGSVDDITIYNEVLTSAQIAAMAPGSPDFLKAEYLFDGNADDTANYAIGTPMNGTLNGGVTLNTDGCYHVATFDGNPGSYISVPFQPKIAGGTNLTIMGWVKPAMDEITTTPPEWQFVMGAGAPYYFVRWTGSTFAFNVVSSSPGAPCLQATGTAGTWQHVAATYDGTIAKLYINGVKEANIPYSGGLWQDPMPFTIGQGYTIFDDYGVSMPGGRLWPNTAFKGSIGDVRLFGKALNADEINGYMMLNRQPLVTATACGSRWTQLPDNMVELSGDANNPNSPYGLTFAWTKDSGPGAVTFDPNPTVKNPVATFSAAGDYVLRFTATATGSCNSDYRTVNVKVYPVGLGPLVAHYTFENGLIESSGYNTTGQDANGVLKDNAAIVNDPNGVHGKVLNCYVNNSNGWMECAGVDRIAKIRRALTVAAWVKSTVPGTNLQGIVGRGLRTTVSNWGWVLNRQNYAASFNSGQLAGDIGDGRWHHVAATYNDTETSCVYIDGVLANIVTGVHGPFSKPTGTTTQLRIGRHSSDRFSGYIDDVRVYEQSLSASQIAALVPKGNLNGDSKVDFKDMAIMASNWQKTTACTSRIDSPTGYDGYVYTLGDYNRDCKVDMNDVTILAETWLATATN